MNDTYLKYLYDNKILESLLNDDKEILINGEHIKIRNGLCAIEENRILFRNNQKDNFNSKSNFKMTPSIYRIIKFLYESQTAGKTTGATYTGKDLESKFTLKERTIFNRISELNILFKEKYNLPLVLNDKSKNKNGYYFNNEIV